MEAFTREDGLAATESVFSLPRYPELSDADVNEVASVVRSFGKNPPTTTGEAFPVQ